MNDVQRSVYRGKYVSLDYKYTTVAAENVWKGCIVIFYCAVSIYTSFDIDTASGWFRNKYLPRKSTICDFFRMWAMSWSLKSSTRFFLSFFLSVHSAPAPQRPQRKILLQKSAQCHLPSNKKWPPSMSPPSNKKRPAAEAKQRNTCTHETLSVHAKLFPFQAVLDVLHIIESAGFPKKYLGQKLSRKLRLMKRTNAESLKTNPWNRTN